MGTSKRAALIASNSDGGPASIRPGRVLVSFNSAERRKLSCEVMSAVPKRIAGSEALVRARQSSRALPSSRGHCSKHKAVVRRRNTHASRPSKVPIQATDINRSKTRPMLPPHPQPLPLPLPLLIPQPPGTPLPRHLRLRHRDRSNHAALAPAGLRVAAARRRQAGTPQRVVQTPEAALALRRHVVLRAHGDEAGLVGVEVGREADGLEGGLVVGWGWEVLEGHFAGGAEVGGLGGGVGGEVVLGSGGEGGGGEGRAEDGGLVFDEGGDERAGDVEGGGEDDADCGGVLVSILEG